MGAMTVLKTLVSQDDPYATKVGISAACNIIPSALEYMYVLRILSLIYKQFIN